MCHKLTSLCLEVTNKCGLSCLHCSSNSVNAEVDTFSSLPFEIAKTVVTDFTSNGGIDLSISGGEPFLWPHYQQIIEFGKSLGLNVKLYTSGTIGKSDCEEAGFISQQCAEELRALGLDKIIFSLQGALRLTHEKITGVVGSYERAIKSITNSKAAGIWVGVHFVPMRLNWKELYNVLTICEQLNVDELGVLRFVSQGRGYDNREHLELTPDVFLSFMRELRKARANARIPLRIGCHFNVFSNYDTSYSGIRCSAAIQRAVVTPTGDLFPCPGMKHIEMLKGGNVISNNLNSIWSDGFRPIRHMFAGCSAMGCASCDNKTSCHGGCLAQKINSECKLNISDPQCPFMFPAQEMKAL